MKDLKDSMKVVLETTQISQKTLESTQNGFNNDLLRQAQSALNQSNGSFLQHSHPTLTDTTSAIHHLY